MGGIFSKPKAPPPPPPPPPKIDDAAVQAAGEAVTRREKIARKGSASTMLTGGSLGEAEVGTKKLLGK